MQVGSVSPCGAVEINRTALTYFSSVQFSSVQFISYAVYTR